jgi:hypothetical protein
MRKTLIILSCLVLSITINAKSPKLSKNAKGGICTIITFDDKGQKIGEGNGFFIDADGTGVTEYKLLRDASKAETIDASGKVRDINHVTGADGLYEVVKFTVTPDKHLKYQTLSSTETLRDDEVYIVPYSTERKSKIINTRVLDVMNISDDRFYYKLKSVSDSDLVSLPVFDKNGTVIGTIQKGNDVNDTCLYVLDARYAADIEIGALSLSETVYKDIKMKKALPAKEEQALSYIYLKQSSPKDEYVGLLDDFVTQFPNSADGYFNRGSYALLYRDSVTHIQAISDINKAIEIAEEKDLFHYDYANLIYGSLTQNINIGFDFWTLDKALEEVDIALSIKNMPIYLQLKGKILYAQKKYQESYDTYCILNKTNLASAETYMFTYAIKRELGGDLSECIALLDTAINFNGKPYSQKIAPYILTRASVKEEAGKYREAVSDYIEYENLIGSYNMTSEFYFYREQIEIKAKMYEPALKDIEKARSLAPKDSSLTLEHASLYLRLSMNEEALPLLTQLVSTYPDNSDCRRLLGICYMRKEDKENACIQLNAAKQLGDTLADDLIQQNCK